MYAVTGITGKVGSVVARHLLAAGSDVRAVVRSAAKGAEWEQAGCETALADLHDSSAMARAFADTEGVFVMLPPNFDPAPGFPEPRALIDSLARAIDLARPSRVVCLSTIGAQAGRPSLLQPLGWLEDALAALPVPTTFLRAAWFIENFAWDVASARDEGVLRSFLHPADRAIPMVATADVGRVAAELLQAPHPGPRIVELEGPRAVSPRDAAARFSVLLGRQVSVRDIPAEQWQALFLQQGMRNPLPRAQMLEGFNQGWLRFEGTAQTGQVDLDTVLRELIEANAQIAH